MAKDKWGLKFIYPTKKTAGITNSGTGFFYQQGDDITKDKYFNDEGHVTNSGGGQWTMSTSGPDAVQVGKNGTDDSAIGGCNMDFDATAKRGYSYKSDDPRDIELTFLVKFVDSGSDNGFALEGPTGPHSSSGCCSGFAYKLDVQYRQNPTKFRFRKEMFHVSNHTDPDTGEFTHSKFNFQLLGRDDWTGFKWIRYNKKDAAKSGHNTTDAVVLELWANTDPDNDPEDGWFLVKRTTDDGGWGDDGDECNGDKDQIGSWSSEKMRLKSNDSSGEFDFKHLSFREIDPFAAPDDTPEEPEPGEEPQTTKTIQGKFKFQWDLNIQRTSVCQGSGGASFYAVGVVDEKSIGRDDVPTTIVAQQQINSTGVMNGKTIGQVDVPLKKVGSPTGTVFCAIWNGFGTEIYTSPTTFDPSTFTTSFVTKTFDFSTNTHKCVTGDRIGISYNEGDDDNYIMVGYNAGSSSGDDYAYYRTDTGWGITHDRNFACEMWE